MSHIPSAAMPHAKPHEQPAMTNAKRPPWLAIAVGGILAVGGAIGAAIALRPKTKAVRRRTRTRKPRGRKASNN